MEVILIKDVEKVGRAGMAVKVNDGYGRNYLLPRGFAVLSTAAALKKLEQEKAKRDAEYERGRKEAEDLQGRLSALSLTIAALTKEDDKEKLYGSVTQQDIAAALKDEGCTVDKHDILLAEAIKAVGRYEVPVKLHPEVTAKVKIWIVKK